jgi:hypothetical protein
LSPPYLEDSLPMAIATLIQDWQVQHSVVQVDLKLPSEWTSEPPERSRVLLIAVGELLRIALPEPKVLACVTVSLEQVGSWSELRFQVVYPNLGKSIAKHDSLEATLHSHDKELKALQHAFRLLTQGECYRRQRERTTIWYFRWRCDKAIKNID